MEVLLESVVSKNNSISNKYIGDVFIFPNLKTGRRCDLYFKKNSNYIKTSVVERYRFLENRLEIQTQNSVYVFSIICD